MRINWRGTFRICQFAALPALAAMAACSGVPSVPVPEPGTTDASPPLLKLGSAGLRRDILLTQDSTVPERRRAMSHDDVFFLATATDAETGVRRVSLRGEQRTICVPVAANNLITIVDPIAEDQAAPTGGSTLPGQLAKQFGVQVISKRHCPSGSTFLEFHLELRAEAENGLGQVRQLQSAFVDSFGPDTIKVGTFNLYRPGNHPDSVYERWGRVLGSMADVLLLTEVADRRRAEIVANSAGMPYVVVLRDSDSDIAIASRTPLRDVQRQTIDPPGALSSNDSNILSAQTDLGGYPHQVVVTHWGIRDANDELFGPERSSPSRGQAAAAILQLIAPRPAIAIVGGDLNAYSGIGPQVQSGSTAEVDLIRTRMVDAFAALGLPEAAHCSNQRIDYVFVSGPYAPVAYEACFADSSPSDHPFVLVTLVAD
jgi:endonuclease/exonuclease/phosphatase family metal-dependent hydrolase